jgi:hypothetical protein
MLPAKLFTEQAANVVDLPCLLSVGDPEFLYGKVI